MQNDDTPAPAAATPEQVVQAQLDAYNAHDVEAFAATYGPDIRIYEHPGQLKMEGIERLRDSYGRLFASVPALRASVGTRIVQGAFVIDHETVTGLANGGRMSAVAIYEVRDGLIRNVWFIH